MEKYHEQSQLSDNSLYISGAHKSPLWGEASEHRTYLDPLLDSSLCHQTVLFDFWIISWISYNWHIASVGRPLSETLSIHRHFFCLTFHCEAIWEVQKQCKQKKLENVLFKMYMFVEIQFIWVLKIYDLWYLSTNCNRQLTTGGKCM